MNVASKQQVAAAQVVFFVRSRIFTFPAGGGQGLSTWGHTFQTLDYSLSNATKLFKNLENISFPKIVFFFKRLFDIWVWLKNSFP